MRCSRRHGRSSQYLRIQSHRRKHIVKFCARLPRGVDRLPCLSFTHRKWFTATIDDVSAYSRATDARFRGPAHRFSCNASPGSRHRSFTSRKPNLSRMIAEGCSNARAGTEHGMIITVNQFDQNQGPVSAANSVLTEPEFAPAPARSQPICALHHRGVD